MPTPGVRRPSNPTLAGATPNLPSSKGFEGMSISPDGTVLPVFVFDQRLWGPSGDPRRRFLLDCLTELDSREWSRCDVPVEDRPWT